MYVSLFGGQRSDFQTSGLITDGMCREHVGHTTIGLLVFTRPIVLVGVRLATCKLCIAVAAVMFVTAPLKRKGNTKSFSPG